jgi:asparagine synthase (glutamine-hydrolysing)
MPGLLVACPAQGRDERARTLFEHACVAYTRFKELPRTSQFDDKEAGILLARFALPTSPYPEIHRAPEGDVLAAAAGWWYDADAPDEARPSLPDFAQRWRRQRDGAFNCLQGQHVVLVCDRRARRITAAPDRLGWFPVYVAQCEDIAWLCTSSLPLAFVLRPQLDVLAVRALLLGNTVRSPHSLFDGIRRVRLGERVTLGAGQLSISQVWFPFDRPPAYRRIEDAAEDGIARLRRACRRIRQAWPRWVCDLTAGLDSRLVVATMAEPGVPVNVMVGGPSDNYDVSVGKTIAARFGWPMMHLEKDADWGQRRWPYFREGVALSDGESISHTMDDMVERKHQLKSRFDVSFGGGGGELWRDWFWQQEFLKIGRTSTLDLHRLIRYRFFLSPRLETGLFERDWRADYIADQVRTMEEVIAPIAGAVNTAKLDALFIWKQSGGFGRVAGALFPLTATVHPIGVAEIVEFAASLPRAFRLHSRLIRHMTARIDPELARMPTSYGGSAEPISISRPAQYAAYQGAQLKKLMRKLSLVMLKRELFRDPGTYRPNPAWNRDFVGVLKAEGLLNPDNLRTATLYQPDGLKRFLGRASQADFADFGQLFAIMTVEILCDQAGIVPTHQKL